MKCTAMTPDGDGDDDDNNDVDVDVDIFSRATAVVAAAVHHRRLPGTSENLSKRDNSVEKGRCQIVDRDGAGPPRAF